MSVFLRKLQFLRSKLSRQKPDPDEIVEELWIADFGKEKHARFDIKSESSYDANLRKNLFYPGHSLVLALKKESCIAWVEAPEHRYGDMVISGAIRLDSRGGYGAGGILFRMVDSGTHYSLLISSKSYFRLDVIRNGMPLPLVGWTELPQSTGSLLGPDQTVDFKIIAYGGHFVIVLRGEWAAEISDTSIPEGTLCLTAASYESGDPAYSVIRNTENAIYTTEVFLESFSVDSRVVEVQAAYEKWHDSPDIDPQARIRLAETFAAMEQHNAAMVQLTKSWNKEGHQKTQMEYLLAGQLAQRLGLMADAEKYISECFQLDVESHEGKEAVTEMAKILYTGKRFKELKNYCAEAIKIKTDDPALWIFQGHACWSLKDYKNAAAAYEQAFELDKENGIPAKNAANVYEVMGRKKEALACYLEAGSVFLKAGNYNDLGLLVPKLTTLGEDNQEARSLAGKWAFAVEDWKMAEAEFKQAEINRKAKRPKPRKDGAQVFLEALLLIRTGKRKNALPLLKEAVSLEKKYALFHFRLAENIFLLEDNPDDPDMLEELNTALSLIEKDSENVKLSTVKDNENLEGWVNNFAAQIALKKGNLETAAAHLEKAVRVLGDLPAVRVNQGVLYYLQGSLDKALEVLEDNQDDPEGIKANCAGNLLVRARRFEDADKRYRSALAAMPKNVEYLCNRATCLIELEQYGEADRLLARAHKISLSPAVLEMISYVAVKKGEYVRAEQACNSALEIDPHHAPSLLSLGWVHITMGKKEEAGEIVKRLDQLELRGDTAKGREELRSRLKDLTHTRIECDSCNRSWSILKDPPPAPAIRLFAMPPDKLPAGSCLGCGKTYCIGCAKENLDPNGRFVCPVCRQPLKLINEGLKRIIHEWAVKEGISETEKPSAQGPDIQKDDVPKGQVDNSPADNSSAENPPSENSPLE